MSKLTTVVGGQFGSCGKGAVVAWIATQEASKFQNTAVIRVGGPNAGHTAYGVCGEGPCTECDQYGHPWRLRQVPAGAVSNLTATLIIAPGSEIDLEVLNAEVTALDRAGYNASGRLYIDKSATIITDEHKRQERDHNLTGRIGSTGKGIGAARADRLWRSATLAGDVSLNGLPVHDTVAEFRDAFRDKNYHVIIEGTQGYGLGIHTDYYPYTTSGDCRAVDFMAQAGLSPWDTAWHETEVLVAARTYPIRVAGASGPLKGETDWETLGLPTERTTVTQKVRRVGTWDPGLVRAAVAANGGGNQNPGVRLVLTMVDHLLPKAKNISNHHNLDRETLARVVDLVYSVGETCGASVKLIGTGPNSMIDADNMIQEWEL